MSLEVFCHWMTLSSEDKRQRAVDMCKDYRIVELTHRLVYSAAVLLTLYPHLSAHPTQL